MAQKFDFLRASGIALFPQDGCGVTEPRHDPGDLGRRGGNRRRTSQAARRRRRKADAARRTAGAAVQRGAKRDRRRRHQRQIDHDRHDRLDFVRDRARSHRHERRRDEEFRRRPDAPFASALVGGAICSSAKWTRATARSRAIRPRIAVVNNIALDHKSMDELRALFRDFVAKAELAVLNLDNEETASLGRTAAGEPDVDLQPDRTRSATCWRAPYRRARRHRLRRCASATAAQSAGRLQVPGRHNVSNALAAIGAVRACGPVAGGIRRSAVANLPALGAGSRWSVRRTASR